MTNQPAQNQITITINDTNLIAMKKYFGFKVGQTLKEFKAEIDLLNPAEAQELGDAIRATAR